MSTAISTSISPAMRKDSTASTTSTRSRHRRSTVSLSSSPGLGLIRTISRDLCTGWHTPASSKTSSDPDTSPTNTPKLYKPRHAARDALKTSMPQISIPSSQQQDARLNFETSYLSPASPRDVDIRSRQDSVSGVWEKSKETARLGTGLVPDHTLDSWSAGWDVAFERRNSTLYNPNEARRGSNTRMSGRLSVTDADVRKFCFSQHGNSRKGSGFESPEGFLLPGGRRDSEVPSLVLSEVSSRDTRLEDLEEISESESEKEEEGEKGKGKGDKRWGVVFEEPVVVLDKTAEAV